MGVWRNRTFRLVGITFLFYWRAQPRGAGSSTGFESRLLRDFGNSLSLLLGPNPDLSTQRYPGYEGYWFLGVSLWRAQQDSNLRPTDS